MGRAKLRQAHTGRADVDPAELLKIITDATADVRKKLGPIKQTGKSITIAGMFEMGVLMNHLGQLSEMSTSVARAANSAISSMARNGKS